MRAGLLLAPQGGFNREGLEAPELREPTGRRGFGRRDESDAAEETMLAGRRPLASGRRVMAQHVRAMGRG